SFLRRLLGRGLGSLAREHRVLEVLEGCDARDALGLDAHLLAGRGVPRHARRTIDALELREARDRDVVAARDAVRDDLEGRGHQLVSLLAGYLVGLCEVVEQLASIHKCPPSTCWGSAGCIVARCCRRCRDLGAFFQGFSRDSVLWPRAGESRYGRAGAIRSP